MKRSSQRVMVHVGEELVSPADLVTWVQGPGSGAVVLFLGTVRDHSPGKTGVTHLEYETYEEMVESKIRSVADTACERWPVDSAAVVHRTGRVLLGEASVGVAVACAHRADAFDAAEYIIDTLKVEAPIWKKEYWPGGAEWSQGS